MDSSEQKFFEALAGAKSEADTEYEIELAKANSGSAVVSRTTRTAKPKMIESEEDAPMRWDDSEPEGQLTVDVYQTASEIVVESAIAGVRPEDIDIQVTPDSISIRGARRREKEVHDEDYLYQECYWGRFARSIILPQEVDPDGANVSFKNGILVVRLPKADKKKTKRLRVKLD